MPLLTRHTGPEEIAWSIGGVPVNLEWDTCRMTAPGGYETMSGRVTGTLQTRKLRQGSVVLGVRPNGKVLYKGTLISRPKIVNDVAFVEAEGFQAIIRRRNKRLPYVIADASQWSQSNELPFDYPASKKYALESKANGLGWRLDNNTNYTSPDRAGYGLYVPEHPVQRLKATIRKDGNDDSNFDLEVRDADDLGSASVVTTKTLGAGTADGDAWNVNAVNQNTVIVNVICNAGGSVAGTNMRVNLQDVQACCIADDNDWITSDVASDIASRVGFADNVESSTTEIGPLDWTGGWDELLDYMAAIEDWTWMVEEDTTKGPKNEAMLTFRDWGRHTWTTNLDLANESLTVAPLYNRVTVHYERPAGVPQHKSYSVDDFNDLTDPVADGRTYEYPDPPVLENPQRNTSKADAIGEKLLRRVVALRLVGNIKVAGLIKGSPFDIKAGDKLKVEGFNPDAPPQRIASVTYHSDGTVDCTLERSFDIAAMLFRLSAHRRRSTPHKWGSGHRS